MRQSKINKLKIKYCDCRRAKLHPHKQRSKYICKPDAVVEAGNHFVWEFITGRGSLNVPPDAGILHHYRVSFSDYLHFMVKIDYGESRIFPIFLPFLSGI